MADVNACVIGGTITKSAETKSVGAKGTLLTKFSIDNNTGFGQYAKRQNFDVQMWGVRGQNIASSLTVGKKVITVGTLEENSWTSQDGQTHSSWQITANDLQFVTSDDNTTSREEVEW